jgi:hypothetical protein
MLRRVRLKPINDIVRWFSGFDNGRWIQTEGGFKFQPRDHITPMRNSRSLEVKCLHQPRCLSLGQHFQKLRMRL